MQNFDASLPVEQIEYQTVREGFETESMIQKSRFITRVYPISSEEEAQEIITSVKKEHYKATHVCSAWVLHTLPEKMKASDDGEPSGTAGRPILEVIRRKNLQNVLVLVIRYFGGIKLGAGGLCRAYAGGCSDVLREAALIRKEYDSIIRVEMEYTSYQTLKYQLEKKGIKPADEQFTDMVALTFEIPFELTNGFISLVEDITDGGCLCEILETQLIDHPLDKEKICLTMSAE